MTVAPPDRQPGDEVVEDEVVQDDDPGAPPQGLDDPAVRLGVVADVVETDVASARSALAAAARDGDLEPTAQRGQQQLRVVGDAGPLRRHGREVGDLHASSLSMQRSHVTCSAIALPARP